MEQLSGGPVIILDVVHLDCPTHHTKTVIDLDVESHFKGDGAELLESLVAGAACGDGRRADVLRSVGEGKRVLFFQSLDHIFKLLLCFVVAFGLGVASFAPRASAEIDSTLAVRAILGEARGEGFEGMLAVACALRNRGHLKGVYGLKAPIKEKLSPEVRKAAAKAWKDSRRRDVTHGATHWHNLRREGSVYWTRSKKMKLTAIIGRHYFFEELRK